MSEQSTGVLGVLSSGLVKPRESSIPQGVDGPDTTQGESFPGLLKEQINALGESPELGVETLNLAAPTSPHGNSLPLPLESLDQAMAPSVEQLKVPVGEPVEELLLPQGLPIARQQLVPDIKLGAANSGPQSLPATDTSATPAQPGLALEKQTLAEQTSTLARTASAMPVEQLKLAEASQTQSPSSISSATVAPTASPMVAGETAPRPDVVQIIQTPVGAPGWDQELGTRVNWLVKQNISVAEIRLNPPELGPIAIKIAVDGGDTQIHFVAQHAQSRELLEQASFRLRESLMESGFSSVNVDVGDGQTSGFNEKREADTLIGDNSFQAEDKQSAEPGITMTKQGLVDKYA